MKNEHMADLEFSHKVLTMLIANRHCGGIGKFLDKLNGFVKNKEITQAQKEEIFNALQDYFIDEHKVFEQFSLQIENIIGSKL